ncbi:MAG: restriction endonuclease subunit S [Veillonellaceae bacterium]|nr:restriction endonuclease subunit S [Veillonellaceae bacterium]
MREMKDSGIEWIGEIPKDWEITKIGMLYNLRITKVSDTDYAPLSVTKMGVLPQLETVAKTNAHDDRKLVKKGDFVINSRSDRRGSCGISNYYGSVSLINIVLEPKNNMSSGYYSCLFKTVQFADEFYKNGHGIVDDLWTTGWQDMKRIILPVPHYSEQQQIANYLDTKCSEIDATAEDIQKEISLLEEYKKSVITEAVTKGLNPDVEMKDSGIEWIGEIPKDWEFPKITHILDYTHPYPIGDGDHGTIKAENYSEEGIPFIRVQNLGFATELIMNNVVYITEKQNNGIINSTLYPNDILFAKTGATIGKVGIMPENIKKANTTSHVGKITVSEEVVPKYIFYVLSSFIGYKQFWDIALMKSTRPELSIDEIKTLHVLLPKTKEEQQQIADFLDTKCSEIDSLIADKKRQLDILADYKKSLIYEYVTGKKEVPVNE